MPTPIRRRGLLAGAAGATAAGLAAPAAPAIAQSRHRLTMVMPWPKNTPGVAVNAQRFVDRVARMSGGRIEIRLFAGGELVPPFESFDAVTSGAADMAHGTPYYWQGKASVFHLFTGVPFGFTAWEHAAWLRFGGGQELWDAAYGRFGLKPFYAGSSGVQAGGWLKRPIAGLSDLTGLKFRIAGLGGEVMRRLGVSVVLIPPGEIFPAFQSGAIDAAEWVGPWNDLAFGLWKVAKHYYMPAFHEGGPALEVFIRRDRLDALPADLQAILAGAAEATAQETLADFTYHNAESLQPLVDEHGVTLHRWPDDVIAAMGRESLAVLDGMAASDPEFAAAYQSFRTFLAKADRWAQWSDAAYLAMRAAALRTP